MIDDLDRKLRSLAGLAGLADQAPLASGEELRRRGDRRSRTRRLAWAGVVGAIVLSSGLAAGLSLGGSSGHRVLVGGSPSPTSAPVTPTSPVLSPVTVNPSATSSLLPSGAIVEGRVTRPIVLDGGTLRIDPAPPGLPAAFSLQQAISVGKAAETYNQGALNQADIGFGVVHLAATLSRGLPAYRGRPAWVAILAPQRYAMCPPGLLGGLYIPPKPAVHVVLADAQTGGDALDYSSRGNGPCGGPITGPSVQRAQEIVSMPWTAVGETPVTQQQLHRLFPPNDNVPKSAVNWVIRYTIPRCATIFASPRISEPTGPNKPVLHVDVQVPISPPPTCTPARTVTENFGPEAVPVSQTQHAPTGVATGR